MEESLPPNSETKCTFWDSSYTRRENFIFEPKDEVIRFLSRFVRRRVGVQQFVDILQPKGKQLRALDYGCGIGSQTIFMAQKLGIISTGVDISQVAISMARDYAAFSGVDGNFCDFYVLGNDQKLKAEECEYDISICDAVLDSMCFSRARAIVSELARTTSRYIFFSVISGHETGNPEFCGEVIVEHAHEHGTIQAYFNQEKIKRLCEGHGFTIKFQTLQIYRNLDIPNAEEKYLNHLFKDPLLEHGRYYVLLERI